MSNFASFKTFCVSLFSTLLCEINVMSSVLSYNFLYEKYSAASKFLKNTRYLVLLSYTFTTKLWLYSMPHANILSKASTKAKQQLVEKSYIFEYSAINLSVMLLCTKKNSVFDLLSIVYRN